MSLFVQAGNADFPTLAEARVSSIKNISGTCANEDEFTSLINQSAERLLYRGDFLGTVLPIQVQVQRGLVTFPRMVGSVRAFNLCRSEVPVWGQWYRFLDHRWRGSTCFGSWLAWLGQAPVLTESGRSPVYAQPPTSTCVLLVQGNPGDNGKVIQVFGTDPIGNELLTDNGDGTFTDGISLTINQPFGVGTQLVGRITRVIKPATQNYVQLFAQDTSTGSQTQLANWEPSVTNPSYAQYRLGIPCSTPATLTAVALIKLKFVPAVVGSDIILIPNLNALKLMVQAIRLEEAGDDDGAQKKIIKAVRELNLQLSDDLDDDNIPIDVNPFGSATPGRAGIGRVI